MRRILLLAMGGTIACTEVPGRGRVPTLRAVDLAAVIPPSGEYEITPRDFADATTLGPEDWNSLASEIYKEKDNFDGFLVTLGTDTMAYVSSALTLALPFFPKPIILTGGAMIGDQTRDSERNLLVSVQVVCGASHDLLCPIRVVCGGRWLDGSSVSKIRTDGVGYGAFVTTGKSLFRHFVQESSLQSGFSNSVIYIKLVPHISSSNLYRDYPNLVAYRGCFVEGYGDGNVPNDLLHTLERYAADHVLVLGSACTFGDMTHLYEGGVRLLKTGALSSAGLSKEMAYVLLLWSLYHGRTRDDAVRLYQSFLG